MASSSWLRRSSRPVGSALRHLQNHNSLTPSARQQTVCGTLCPVLWPLITPATTAGSAKLLRPQDHAAFEDTTLHGQVLAVLLQLRVLPPQPGQFLGLAPAPAATGPPGPRDPARQRGLIYAQARRPLVT